MLVDLATGLDGVVEFVDFETFMTWVHSETTTVGISSKVIRSQDEIPRHLFTHDPSNSLEP